jgi:type I restriction enzyme S subunit
MTPLRICDLGEVVTGTTPPSEQGELYGEDFPFLTPTDMSFSARKVVTGRSLSQMGAARFQLRLVPPRAVAVVCIGATIGKVCMTGSETLTNQQINTIVVKEARHSPEFVYYLLRTMADRLQAVASGVATPIVNKTVFSSLEIDAPPLPVQRKVARRLTAFDELIENNQRRIEIIEEMARLIYQEWFVNFRFPGHEDVELVDSDLGPMPDGWKVRPLSAVLELAYGKALKADDRQGGDVAVYGSGGIVGWHDEALVDGPGIVVGRKGNVGAVYWSDVDFYPIDTTYFVKSEMPLSFVYHQLQTLEFIDSHAAVPGLSRDQAYSVRVVVPAKGALSSFDDTVSPMYKLRRNLIAQNDVLTNARDLLLPRLISGELDVSDLDLDLEPVA